MKRSRPRESTATNLASALAADRERALALTPVSRETSARLDRLVELLLNWQRTLHLVAPSTVPQLWTRHIADSLQLLALAPQARVWIDLGSGGGFPGVVLACALAESSDAAVHLVESNTRKAAFLREASRVTGAPAHVHVERIEDFGERFSGPADVVTARALAPLNSLLTLAFPLLRRTGAVALLPKGQNAEEELGEAQKTWNIKVNMVPSLTDPAGRIVVMHGLEPRGRTP